MWGNRPVCEWCTSGHHEHCDGIAWDEQHQVLRFCYCEPCVNAALGVT